MKVPQRRQQRIGASFFAVALILAFAAAGQAQDPREVQMPAPPPLRVMPRFDRDQIDTGKDAKDRLRITIELADAHLLRAEELANQNKHEAGLIELGLYMALIDDAMRYLGGMKSDSNRVRDLYKRLELNLRAQWFRLAAIRRVSPAEYAGQIKAAEEFARSARTDALDSFYGHTVLREAAKDPSEDKRAKDSTAGAPKRP